MRGGFTWPHEWQVRRPRRLPGHHFATLSAICQQERERRGEAPEDDDLEESLGLQAGVFPAGRQKSQRSGLAWPGL